MMCIRNLNIFIVLVAQTQALVYKGASSDPSMYNTDQDPWAVAKDWADEMSKPVELPGAQGSQQPELTKWSTPAIEPPLGHYAQQQGAQAEQIPQSAPARVQQVAPHKEENLFPANPFAYAVPGTFILPDAPARRVSDAFNPTNFDPTNAFGGFGAAAFR
jgi:hypothetical protein